MSHQPSSVSLTMLGTLCSLLGAVSGCDGASGGAQTMDGAQAQRCAGLFFCFALLFFGAFPWSAASAQGIPGVPLEELRLRRSGSEVFVSYVRGRVRAGAPANDWRFVIRVVNDDRGAPSVVERIEQLGARGEIAIPINGHSVVSVSVRYLDQVALMRFPNVGPLTEVVMRTRLLGADAPPGAPTPPHVAAPIGSQPTVPWSRASVVAACGEHFDGDANEQRCVSSVANAHTDPVPVIAACAEHFDGDDNEQACMERAMNLRVSVEAIVQSIAACEQQFEGDAAELRCLQALARP